MKCVVVVPTYNEAANVHHIAEAVLAHNGLDLLIVDDNSPDGTGDIADQLAHSSQGRMAVLHRAKKDGLGRAYVDAFLWCLENGYDTVGQMDADLSHDPRDLPDLFAATLEGAEVVIGSRYLNGISVINWPLRRILLSLGANEYVKWVTNLSVHDATSGFRVYTSNALRMMDIGSVESNGYSFQVEMTYRAHLCACEIVELPIVFTERRLGQSKMSQGVIFESALMPWKLLFKRHKLIKQMEEHLREVVVE